MATVSERIKKIIANHFGIAEKDIKPDSRFMEDLNADSLDMVQLTIAMEEEFSTPKHALSIPDEDADNIKTVQDAIDYIRNLGSGDRPAKTSAETTEKAELSGTAKKGSFINKFFKRRHGK
ncbi:MAG: acyl carrier protein [Dehalococcoidales bacterium]|jgi:acyl carrier protein|nr:acyl carrier protein [Dehalococcoidales bacterium]